jgi:GNAT superfamily N-acetyltransferase
MKELLNRLRRYISRRRLRYFPGPPESILYQIGLGHPQHVEQPLVQGEFRVVHEEDLDGLERDLSHQQLDLFRQRFMRRKDTMVGYFASEHLVYWGWISFNDDYFEPHLDISINIPSNAGYIYHTETVPAFQRKGIHTAGMFKLLEIIKQNGKERALVLIDKRNLNATWAIRRFGPKRLQRLRKKTDSSG